MNYLNICQKIEQLNQEIKDYTSIVKKKEARVKVLEEYKKSLEDGVGIAYVEAKENIKLVNPIFILFNSELYFEELKRILVKNYKLLSDKSITLIQNNWNYFEIEQEFSLSTREKVSKIIFSENLSEDYYSELLLEINKLDDFSIEKVKIEASQKQEHDFFTDIKSNRDFDYTELKRISKFKVEKFEKILQLLNFPKVITVKVGMRYVLNEDTKEYEAEFSKLERRF